VKEVIVKVFEAMTPDVVTVAPDASLTSAARLMRESDIGPLPVCEQRRIVGMLTDRDITVRAIAEGRDPNTTRVDEVMTPEVICCMEADDIERAAQLMQSSQLRRLLVVDGEGRLAGIVSLGDLALQTGDDALSGQTLERVSEPPAGR
jgi:CBS domain-containing protein